MKNIEPLKSPIEYFHKIAFLANSKVEEDDNKLLFINVDNAYSKGVSELLPFSNGCFAANTSCFFFQGFETDYTFKYTKNWLPHYDSNRRESLSVEYRKIYCL